ncbi:MAG: lyase family protein, partial [bacterium]|nr:lyase family protein [bacterium]
MANLQLPGNPRYQPADLREIFGYDNLYRPVGEVELAALDVLAEIGVIPAEDFVRLTPEIREAILAISTTDVDRVEREVTGHDIRAWVRLAQDLLPPELRRWAHIPLTSYDPLDTARALQFSRAHAQVVRPKAAQVALILADLTERFSEQIQVGRTHGQHALPVTVGFWFATVLNRIMENVRIMDLHASSLTGKVSGAVGAYNAQMALGITREGEASFEERVLGKLGLVPGRISTQIVQPEPLVHYLFSCVTLSAAFGQFGRDARHLMRTEIAEVREQFQEGQVGSSTMAHKRNPINF